MKYKELLKEIIEILEYNFIYGKDEVENIFNTLKYLKEIEKIYENLINILSTHSLKNIQNCTVEVYNQVYQSCKHNAEDVF
ncbi:MAG: hypothetical protein P8X70_01505 [Nanoarchaeota archaeon]